MEVSATSNPPARLGVTALALPLLSELGDTTARSNLVFSPLSIYAALALTAAGARGTTLQEFLALLGARSRDELAEIVRGLAERALADRSLKGGPRVLFAFGVWHDETRKLKPAFRDAAAESYKADTRAVNFREEPGEAVKLINAWAAAATNNLIDSILLDGEVTKQTDILVANAVYFKGMWHVPFRKESTEDDKFHRLDGSTFTAPFMRSWEQHYIACHEGFKVLKLRYKEGHKRSSPFSPCASSSRTRATVSQGLLKMIASSSSSDFMRKHLPTSLVTVGKFKLPRFKLTFSGDMNDILRRLGLQAVFDGKEADLRDMMEDDGTGRPLALERIIHKAVIEVNEEGTEAAAVTTSMKATRSAPKLPRPVPVDFVADHPFVFFVREEKSGAIVFAGTVLEPSPSMAGPVQRQITNENANGGLLSSLRHCLRCLFG